MTQERLFDRVVEVCGVSRLLAPDIIRRACARAGVDADTMSATDLYRALDSVKRALAMFLRPEMLGPSIERIEGLSRDPSGSVPPRSRLNG